MFSIASFDNPLLGGSTIIIFGLNLMFFKACPLSSHMKSIFLILFNSAFFIASSIAYLFISTPKTLLFLLINIPIDPVPQYKSKTLLFMPTYSFILLYSFKQTSIFI